MMLFNILTLFPDMFSSLNMSILKNAKEKGIIEINCINIRDYSENKHKKTDDYPYGGGNGMVMTCQPVISAYESLGQSQHCIYMSAKGQRLTQKKVMELSEKNDITLLCGHYEGIDERIIDKIVDEEISIGDYVLTGGEIPAMVLIDAVTRVLPGVLTNNESFTEESHYSGLLEYPQYTRPEIFEGYKVPEVLLSGNHTGIKKYRHSKSLLLTYLNRPDMLYDRGLSKEEAKILIEEMPEKKDDIIRYIKRS